MTTYVTPAIMADISKLYLNNTNSSITQLFDDLNPVNLGYKYPAIGKLLRTFENNTVVADKFKSLITDFEQRLIDNIIYDLPTFDVIDYTKTYMGYDALSIEILIYSQTQGKGGYQNA